MAFHPPHPLLTFICPQPNHFSKKKKKKKQLLSSREGHRGHSVWRKPEIAGTQAGAGCIPFPGCRLGLPWIRRGMNQPAFANGPPMSMAHDEHLLLAPIHICQGSALALFYLIFVLRSRLDENALFRSRGMKERARTKIRDSS